jgi:hypothetical protein
MSLMIFPFERIERQESTMMKMTMMQEEVKDNGKYLFENSTITSRHHE